MFVMTKNNSKESKPICKHYGICGGCQGQHFLGDDYIKYKILIIEQILSEKISPNFNCNLECIPDDKEKNLRRRVVFSIKKNKLGFLKHKSHEIINLDFCPILSDKINFIIEYLKSVCNELKSKSLLRIAINNVKNKIEIIFIATKEVTKEDIIILSSLSNIDLVSRVYWYSKDMQPIFIKENMYMEYSNYKVLYPPGSFLQATEFGESSINLCVENYIDIIKPTNIVDLFCGLGGHSIYLSTLNTVENIYSYDIAQEAIRSLKNIQCKKIKPLIRDLFIHPLLPKELKCIDTIIINPPREGAKKQIIEIAKTFNVKNVIMIYCDANSFGNDMGILLNNNFILYENTIKIVDQFKYTKHIELIAYLKRV